MSLNPFERALWIDLSVSKRLLALMFVLLALAVISVLLADLSVWLKFGLLLFILLQALLVLPRYGFESRLASYLNRRLPRVFIVNPSAVKICALYLDKDLWRLQFADGNHVVARLGSPLWRWRFFLLLPLHILSARYPRRMSLLLTPWQMRKEQFKLLYARLGWVGGERRDG